MFQDPIVTQVYVSTDYGKFKIAPFNRDINKIHVERLRKAFERMYLVTIIIVNKQFKIIDGQHRFTAAKMLGLPIYYIIIDYSIEEMKFLNTNHKKFDKIDYIKTYSYEGHTEYTKMKEFMKLYPEFGVQSAEMILTNTVGGVNNRAAGVKIDGKSRGRKRNFEEGNLLIPNLLEAYHIADKIRQVKPFYSGYNRRVFVATMIGLFKKEVYNHDHFISKLKLNHKALVHCANTEQYINIIEEIYNYRSRDKGSLKY